MCEAITGITLATSLAIASATATVAGAGIAYMGAQQQAAAAKQQADYKAQIDSNNKVLADRAATDALQRGDIAAQQKANATNQIMGRQKVTLAANGQDPNSDSALDLTTDTAAAGTLDELTIRSNALREATGYTSQGLNYGNQAQLDRMAGQDALDAGALKGASTIIGGAGQVASQWYNFSYGNRQTRPSI